MSDKKLVEEYADRVWNKKDLKAIDELLDPKIVIHSTLGDFTGPEKMKKVAEAYLTAFPDMRVENINAIAEKDLVVLQWKVKATNKGEFKGHRPSGKPVAYEGTTIYRVANGKIVEYWAYIDLQHLMGQLG